MFNELPGFDWIFIMERELQLTAPIVREYRASNRCRLPQPFFEFFFRRTSH